MEGWATGLQLVGLTLRQRPAPADIDLGSGRHRHVADYLAEEVLGHLPEVTRAFLFQTSILDRLNHSLCVAVTGNERSQEMLESLEGANLFLMPMDDSRAWFRYHRLFAGFLQQRLNRQFTDQVDDLHVRAARWHLAHDLPEQAFSHALKGNDIDLVSQVLEGYVAPLMFSGEVGVVVGWFDALPESWLANRPDLMISRAAFLLLTGQPAAAVRIMEHLGQASAPDDPGGRRAVARTNALRCFMACFRNDLPEALTHANRAFQQLPPEDVAFRANIFHALGDTYRSNRQWDEARANYLKVLEWASLSGQHPTIRIITVHSYSALADLELRRGRLRSAQEYWIRALDSIRQRRTWEHYPLPVTGWIHLRLGELAYERNNLEQARDYVARGLERAELGGEPQALIAGRVIMARLELTDGRPDSAERLLAGAQTLLDESSFPDWRGPFERCRTSLWRAQANHRSIDAWVDAMLAGEASGAQASGEDARLALTAVLLHRGDAYSLERARELLQRIIATAEMHDLLGVLVEALTLRAVAHERQANTPAMLIDLEQALRLAEPEGYVRRVVDLGLPIARLLQEVRKRGVMPEYASRLLAAFGGDVGTTPPGDTMLVEPLSARELDVLRLIASGLSNREIAGELFVSPETVKKHTGNIYGKLGVRGRIEAVTRARSLAIID
jgi:LuxR family maltose regulon positive regulatory protein